MIARLALLTLCYDISRRNAATPPLFLIFRAFRSSLARTRENSAAVRTHMYIHIYIPISSTPMRYITCSHYEKTAGIVACSTFDTMRNSNEASRRPKWPSRYPFNRKLKDSPPWSKDARRHLRRRLYFNFISHCDSSLEPKRSIDQLRANISLPSDWLIKCSQNQLRS